MQTLTRQYTLAEYRRLEETSEERHEYCDGKITTMTGGTLEHSAISGNVYATLKMLLKQTSSKPFNSDLRVWIPAYQKGIYPDVLVVEGKPEFSVGGRDEILNPTLIAEVLSRSTEAYDRGDKFKYYRTIPSFTEYLLISQYQPWVERYSKTENGDWLLQSYEALTDSIPLSTGGKTLSLADIYEEVDFSVAQSVAP